MIQINGLNTSAKTARKAFVFIGMRRVGKTYLMYQNIQALLQKGQNIEKIVYLNFEDDRLATFSVDDFQSILDVYYELYPDCIGDENLYFYFDEIQIIEHWEKF